MIAPARVASFDILSQIESRAAFSDYLLNSRRMAAMSPRDRNLATEIVYGTLRWQGLLDHIIMKSSSRPELDPGVRILLRMSVYQMLFMDRVPAHAVVHDAVEISKGRFRSASGFINGVLRRLSKERPWVAEAFDQELPPWVRVSLPQWIWERWAARFGEERAREYGLALNRPPRLALRLTNRLAMSENLPGTFSELVPGAFLIDGEFPRSSSDRSLEAQDEASQLIPQLLGSIPGWRVWDACAAPGGKAAILSSMCGMEGSLVASDIHLARAQRLRAVLERTGASRFEVLVADGRQSPPFRKKFDAVLADVPCSGLGTLRRNPEIKWRFKPDQLGSLQSTQEQILASAAEGIRPGGLLIYSTCSTEPEENEQVVYGFLNRNPEYRLRRPPGPPGIESWLDSDGLLRTFPAVRLWDGFFAALLERKG